MNTSDANRQKYAAVMDQVDRLEEAVADLEKDIKAAAELPGSQDVQTLKEELAEAQVKLAKAREELARLSDGCGRPHPQC